MKTFEVSILGVKLTEPYKANALEIGTQKFGLTK